MNPYKEASMMLSNKTALFEQIKYTQLILVFVLITGAILRIYDLGNKSFWVDELLSIQSSKDIVDVASFFADNTINAHPPLYFLFLKIWSVFSDGEVYLRLLSVIFGILSILATYLLGRQFLEREASVIASFLVAISPFLLLFDREVRMYPQFVFFTLISLFFFIKALRENKNEYWVGFTFFTVLNTYTHYHAFLVIASMWVFYFLRLKTYKPLWKKALISQVVIAICFSFWMPSFLIHVEKWSVLGEGFERFPSIFGLWVQPLYLFFSYSLGQTLLPWNLPIVIPGILIFMFTFFLGMKSFLKSSETLTFFSVFLFIPIFLSLLISNSMPRYMAFLAPLFYLVIGRGISGMSLNRLKIIIVFIILITLGFSLRNYYQNREFHILANTDPWHEVGQYLKENYQRGDFVMSIGDNLPVSYYSGLKIVDLGDEPVRKLMELNESNKGIWLIVSNPAYKKQAEEGIRWMNGHYSLISEKSYFHDPDFIRKARFFRKDFLEYRVKVYHYGR